MFDSPDVVFLYIVGATLAVVIWSVVVYVVEVRRRGSTPWSEWYNDRVVPLYKTRRRSSKPTSAEPVTQAEPQHDERAAA